MVGEIDEERGERERGRNALAHTTTRKGAENTTGNATNTRRSRDRVHRR